MTVNSLAAALKKRARDEISLVMYLIEPDMCEMSPFQYVINIKCSEQAVLSFPRAQCGKARPPLTLGRAFPGLAGLQVCDDAPAITQAV